MSVTTEQAAVWFENRAATTPMPGAREMFKAAADALREKVEREDPKPLTLEELRQMDGEPVWVEPLGAAYGSGEAWRRYGIINGEKVDVPGVDYWHWWLKYYGKEWLAYRHKPKEAAAYGTPKD